MPLVQPPVEAPPDVGIFPNECQLIRNPNELPTLSEHYRFLLKHFAVRTSHSLSCHPLIQHNFCEVLVPMALQTPHLLAALLGLTATHCASIGLKQSQAQIDFLHLTSLKRLQAVLSQPSNCVDDAVVATILTLCTSDIISCGQSHGSWRLHLQGAAAVIGNHWPRPEESPNSHASATSLLWRWFLSLEALSFLSGKSIAAPESQGTTQFQSLPYRAAIDDFAGFSHSLTPIFREINRLAIEADLEQGHGVGLSSVRERCSQIVTNIDFMLASKEPKFPPDVDASLPPSYRTDFLTLNEAYHHVALLQLYSRILSLPSSNPLVQASVQQIIKLVSSMNFLHKPCPGVAVLQPIFMAGCETCQPADRDAIRFLLTKLDMFYGMGNVKRAKEFLEDLWILRAKSGDFEGNIRWDKVMGSSTFVLHSSKNFSSLFSAEGIRPIPLLRRTRLLRSRSTFAHMGPRFIVSPLGA